MSDEASSARGAADDIDPNVSTSYAGSGGLLRATRQPPQDTDQLAAFV